MRDISGCPGKREACTWLWTRIVVHLQSEARMEVGIEYEQLNIRNEHTQSVGYQIYYEEE